MAPGNLLENDTVWKYVCFVTTLITQSLIQYIWIYQNPQIKLLNQRKIIV